MIGSIGAVSMGDKGPNVQTVQMQLNKFGYGLTTDGIFGQATLSAVRDFQSKHGLSASGIVDDATEEALAQGIFAVSQTAGGIQLPAVLNQTGMTGLKIWQEGAIALGIVGLFIYMRS